MTGVILLYHRPSKRMMVQPFRGAWRGGMTDGGATSPTPFRAYSPAICGAIPCGELPIHRVIAHHPYVMIW